MNRDAEDYVETLGVKGGPGELLRCIAKRIPVGQTTTPETATEDLAAEIGRHEQTVRRRRDALERSGVIKVHGGQGVVARYELIGFDGVRPLTDAALPLVGAAPRRARPRPSPPDDTTRDLFDDPPSWGERTVENLVHFARGWWFVLRAFCTRYFVHFARGTIKQRSTSCILHEVPEHPLGVPIDPRARDVHTFIEVHTPTAPLDGPPEREDPGPPRPRRHPWHAWCGTVCVPNELHQEFLRKGHDAAWLTAFYGRRCAAIAPDEKITVNDFTFWRTAMKEELATPRARPSSPGPRRRPDILNTRPCPHEPPCAAGDTAACIDREMAEWQPKKEQSG